MKTQVIRLAALLALLLLAAAPTLAQTGTCGVAPVPTGVSEGEIEVNGLTRSYRLYIPSCYDPSQPVPLVFSLHGFTSNPEQQAHYSGFDALADEEGFIAVYPRGSGAPLRWNAGIDGLNTGDTVDDVAFISALIEHLYQTLWIDPARIYMTGLSNGGGMSHRLACALADRVAAIGTVAGAYPSLDQNDCTPSRPVPVIAFHGTADPIVPYEGNRYLPPITDWAAAWAARNGCDAAPADLPASGSVTGVRYGGCDADAEVILYTVDGGGHTWPGGPALPVFITGPTSSVIDASRVMWAFFQAHPLEDAG
jgi:polyhydroxybutyrate depolymerase